ncbi:aldolase [Neobacillus sp. PS3-40]|uniref:aldolase n=1 Tax=Neobacillus sp. PS3-40 TaxID=3070679 RepID=UPI0027DEB4D7|nr:aldolase [Neobacillus sp. PS3-40]WML46414.1 aldolase [Neobacillus sp. PS3-40]
MYKAFGLTICSEISLPELTQLHKDEEVADIFIDIGYLSCFWDEFKIHQRNFIVKESLVIFQIPNTATFCIKDGKNIIVSPMDGSDYDKIRLYILGTCMGVLLMQRKIFPLHGSAIAINGKAYAFIGNSGAGKSTLASAFINKGFQLLSDDVVAVKFLNEDGPFIMPSYPQQKLWKDSLEKFGMQTSDYRPLFERETKYSIPVNSNFSHEPSPLAGVFELVKTENEHIQICKIEKLERFRTLLYQTYRHSLVNKMGLTEWHFTDSSKIINKVQMYQLKRPTSEFTAQNLVSMILSFIKEREII